MNVLRSFSPVKPPVDPSGKKVINFIDLRFSTQLVFTSGKNILLISVFDQSSRCTDIHLCTNVQMQSVCVHKYTYIIIVLVINQNHNIEVQPSLFIPDLLLLTISLCVINTRIKNISILATFIAHYFSLNKVQNFLRNSNCFSSSSPGPGRINCVPIFN